MLAKLTNVSYASVRRAALQECEPSQQTCLKIASVVMDKAEYQCFIDKNWPHLMQTNVSYPAGNESIYLQRFLESEEHFLIIALSSISKGVTKTEVMSRLGSHFERPFQELIDSGFLKKNQNERWIFEDSVGSPSMELARKMLSCFLKVHDKRTDDIGEGSVSWVAWESVSTKAAKEVYQLLNECSTSVANVIADPNNKGDVLICSGLYTGILAGRDSYEATK